MERCLPQQTAEAGTVFLQPGRAGEINFDPHSPEKPTDREGRHIMRW